MTDIGNRYDHDDQVSAAAELLDRVMAFCKRFIAYPSEDAAVAHALWIAHTHCMPAWYTTPRLAFLSAEKESGKTRALEITELVTPNAGLSINMSAAFMFRRIGDEEKGLPTFLIDEVDRFFNGKNPAADDICAMLNSGYRRGGTVGRCEVNGKKFELMNCPVYCAVALAGLDWLPDTLMSRSIVIRMKRRAPDEWLDQYRPRDDDAGGHWLRDTLQAWASDILPDLALARPNLPPEITDRAADCWEPLIAVADAAGGHWPQRARMTAVTMVTAAKDVKPSMKVRLLADCRTCFDANDPSEKALPSTVLVERLCALPESPWADMKGKPLDQTRLAKFLADWEIKPHPIWFKGHQLRGYERCHFEDVWRRYCALPASEEKASQVSQASQPPF